MKSLLLQQIKDKCAVLHYSKSTADIYASWCKQFILFHDKIHPSKLNESHIGDFLSYLALKKHVSASTQNQALHSILFMYKQVLEIELEYIDNITRAKRPKILPEIFTRDEVIKIINNLNGDTKLVIQILYGSGLRLNECLSLRIKDINIAEKNIHIHAGKGAKDRITILPASIVQSVKNQIEKVKALHQIDVQNGYGFAPIPNALERKFPIECKSLSWQYLFPSSNLSVDPESGLLKRYHIFDTTIQRNLKTVIRKLKIIKHASCHTFRHTFATDMLKSEIDIRTIQKILGHADIRTTMIYTHIVNEDYKYLTSPLDKLNIAI